MPKAQRMATCHPDRRNHGNGKCKRCYQRAWFREFGRYERRPRQQRVGIYPQAVVRVGVKGWGCLTHEGS